MGWFWESAGTMGGTGPSAHRSSRPAVSGALYPDSTPSLPRQRSFKEGAVPVIWQCLHQAVSHSLVPGRISTWRAKSRVHGPGLAGATAQPSGFETWGLSRGRGKRFLGAGARRSFISCRFHWRVWRDQQNTERRPCRQDRRRGWRTEKRVGGCFGKCCGRAFGARGPRAGGLPRGRGQVCGPRGWD